MMKKLNEELNVDLKNGTWSLSTSDNSSNGGSDSGGGSDSTRAKVDSTKTKVDSTNPKSADYYNDYQTDEIESEGGKKTNYNSSSDYSDYSSTEEDNGIPQVNNNNRTSKTSIGSGQSNKKSFYNPLANDEVEQ